MNYDHWSPINFGSPDDDDHVWPLCDPCNAEKLKKDLADIAHTRRLREGPKKSKRSIPSRGFDRRHNDLNREAEAHSDLIDLAREIMTNPAQAAQAAKEVKPIEKEIGA